jgi:hypothetical protein
VQLGNGLAPGDALLLVQPVTPLKRAGGQLPLKGLQLLRGHPPIHRVVIKTEGNPGLLEARLTVSTWHGGQQVQAVALG